MQIYYHSYVSLNQKNVCFAVIGMHLWLHGKKVLVKGAVLAMLADTPAAHAISGFKVGVGFALKPV